ncbi:hypothetical protein [Teredinibacter turnerae]|uniref:hypothetical protein n=1 Tax=Teredinibacter turnerae TaxID=2426 RepID=UPI000476F012|nr:hypothetical protein [Teredinibacter turnerae]
MKKLNIIAILSMALFSTYGHASWMEFCYVTGTIEKIVSSKPGELIFDLKVESAEKFSPGENLNSYVDCKDYVGKSKRVYYGAKALEKAGKLTVGMSHCARYEHEDWGDGGIRFWFPECKNG